MQLRVLSDKEIRAEAQRSDLTFAASRRSDEQRRIDTRFEQFRTGLAQLLDETGGLTDMSQAVALASRRADRPSEGTADLLDVLRLVTMPPLGPSDLEFLSRISRRKTFINPREQGELERLLVINHDRRRFPWIDAGRQPSDCEREVALCATATLAVAQSLPIISRQVAIEQERRAARELIALGWDRLPSDIPVRHLPARTFIQVMGAGPDYLARLPDHSLALIEVKADASRLRSFRKVFDLLTSWAQRVEIGDYAPVLILYGGADARAISEFQELGGRVVFGHLIAEAFGLDENPTELTAWEHGQASPGEDAYLHLVKDGSRWSRLEERVVAAPDGAMSEADIASGTAKIRAAAALLQEMIGPGHNARTGRLGRRKGVPESDGYRGQYVHFVDSGRDRLALWIYFAEEGHDFSVPGFPTGFWVGLKRDSAGELPEEIWASRLAPEFTWMEHVDPRWAGFRHFLEGISLGQDDREAAQQIADWLEPVLEKLGVLGEPNPT